MKVIPFTFNVVASDNKNTKTHTERERERKKANMNKTGEDKGFVECR